MNIVLVSDHEALGGAAQSTCRLAESLCQEYTVTRLVLFPDERPRPWRTVVLGRESPLRRQLLRLPRRLWPARYPRPATPAAVADELRAVLARLRPDVINLHNLHGGYGWGWRPELAAVAAAAAPVVWTLHDMWSFTGRCAYSYDCRQFVTGCTSDCPTAAEPPALAAEEIAAAWRVRRSLLRDGPLVAVTPSRWLAAEARRGGWSGQRVEVIPYGVPLDTYQPMSRADARQALGITPRGPVVLLSAHDLTERRKGAEIVPAVWPRLRHRPLTIVTMGHGTLPVAGPGLHLHPLGWVADDATRRRAYNAADVLLHPAPVDNLPNVVLEALACGTPVVALPIGGVPEMVRPGVTGWLAAAPTAAALAGALDQALTDQAAGLDLRPGCRHLAEREYSPALQAERYSRLFEELRASG